MRNFTLGILLALLLGLNGDPFMTDVVYANTAVMVGDTTGNRITTTKDFFTIQNTEYPDWRFMFGVDQFGLFLVKQNVNDSRDFEILQRWK